MEAVTYFRNDVGEPGRKMKMKVLLRLLARSRCPLRCLPTEACVCVHATVQVCRVPSTSRLIGR